MLRRSSAHGTRHSQPSGEHAPAGADTNEARGRPGRPEGVPTAGQWRSGPPDGPDGAELLGDPREEGGPPPQGPGGNTVLGGVRTPTSPHSLLPPPYLPHPSANPPPTTHPRRPPPRPTTLPSRPAWVSFPWDSLVPNIQQFPLDKILREGREVVCFPLHPQLQVRVHSCPTSTG